MTQKLKKVVKRSALAGKGALVGAFVGGLFGRKQASIGGAVGASVGFVLSDRKQAILDKKAAIAYKKNELLNTEQE